MEQRKEQEWSKASGDWRKLRRGWCWGPKAFRQEMLELIGEKRGGQHHGAELRESDEQKAERLVGEMLRAAGWRERELRKHPKGDGRKARMAARLRQETPMNWAWIARRLAMGHWRTAANAVRTQQGK